MKNKFFLLLCLCIAQITNAQVWQTVGNAGFTGGYVSNIPLVVNAGMPYVAYSDGANSFKATVLKFDGTDWVAVGTSGFSTGGTNYIGLDFMGTTPYVAFTDAGNTNKANVMKFDGTDWVAVGDSNFTTNAVSELRIKIINNVPYIAFADNVSNKANVMKFDGTNWVSVGAPDFTTNRASFISLADNGAIPYIAFCDYSDSLEATVMKFDTTNNTWVTIGGTGCTPTQAAFLSLTVDNNTPYLAFGDFTFPSGSVSSRISVIKYNGTSWVSVGSAGISTADSYNPVIKIHNGTPYLAFTDFGLTPRKVRALTFDGTDWNDIGGNIGISAGLAQYPSISFDGNIPYIAYRDDLNSAKGTVLKFDVLTSVSNHSSSAKTINIYPNPANTYLTIDVQEPTLISIYDIMGQVVATQTITTPHTIDISRFAAGVYFLNADNGQTLKFTKF